MEFMKQRDLAGAAAWGMERLTRLASKAPEPTGWNLMTKAMGDFQEAIGDAITEGLDPWFKRAEKTIQIGERLAKTGFGRTTIQATALTGVLSTITGVLLIFGAQVFKSVGYFRSFWKEGGALVVVLKKIIAFLGPAGAVAAAALLGWELGNLLNRFQAVRTAAQRALGAVMAGIKGLQGLFGDEQAKKDAQIYWDIATGKIPVGEEPVKNVGVFKWMSDQILEIMDDTRKGPEALAASLAKTNQMARELAETVAEMPSAADVMGMPERPPAPAVPEAAAVDEAALQREADLRRQIFERRGMQEEMLALTIAQRQALIDTYGTEQELITTATEADLARFNQLESMIEGYHAELASEDPWNAMMDQMQAASDLTQIGFNTMMQGVQGLGNLVGTGLRNAFGKASNAVEAFIQDLLIGLAQAIAQALILKAIMAAFGGGAGGFLGGLFQQPGPDFLARFEGGRFAQLFMQGIRREIPVGATAAFATATAGTEIATRPYEIKPVVKVEEATPMTKITVYDDWFADRVDELAELETEAD
jgi:hypothetical protein